MGIAKIAIPTKHGAISDKEQLSSTNYYNLDAIISVGYRVDSIRATHFRKWATGVLKEYMVRGFAMDDERLKQGKTTFGRDYFRASGRPKPRSCIPVPTIQKRIWA